MAAALRRSAIQLPESRPTDFHLFGANVTTIRISALQRLPFEGGLYGRRHRENSSSHYHFSKHLLTVQDDIQTLPFLVPRHAQADDGIGDLQQHPACEGAPGHGGDDGDALDCQ